MANWDEVLDLQLEVHNWLTSDKGRTFGAGYFASAFAASTGTPIDHPLDDALSTTLHEWQDEPEARAAGADWANSVGVNTFNAEPIWVDPDMMTVLEAAVDGFTPEPLVETDLITPNGFLVLPRSMWLLDPAKRHLSWKAALWFPTKSGIHLALFHDVEDPDDIDEDTKEFTKTMVAMGNRWTARFLPTHIVNWPFGEMHPGDWEHPVAIGPDGAWSDAPPMDFAPTGDHAAALSGEPLAGVAQHTTEGRGLTAHRQLQGIWRLLTQYLAVPTQQRPPRQAWKRAKAARLPHEHVTVVRLRRPPQERETGDPVLVNWTHRWIVGGHWRNQFYPSLGIHRQIWISPYTKGPQDLPLVVNKARIFELVR